MQGSLGLFNYFINGAEKANSMLNAFVEETILGKVANITGVVT